MQHAEYQTLQNGLKGFIGKADVEMLKQCMEQIELIEKQQATCLNHLEKLAHTHFAKEISLLCTIMVSAIKACVRQESS
jgi:hypothetical protein